MSVGCSLGCSHFSVDSGNRLTAGPRLLSFGERDRRALEIATTSYPQDCTTYGGKALKVHKCRWRRIEEQPMTHGGGGRCHPNPAREPLSLPRTPRTACRCTPSLS